MLKKIFLIFFCLIFLASPVVVLADTDSKIPQLNPLCWQKSKCAEVRKALFGADAKKDIDSWCVKEDPCSGDIGDGSGDYWCKCLPAGQTNTTIKIGGKSAFNNLGEYLLTVYDYALKIAGIIAVLVIIVAGVQWMVSGGNSSVIEASKKRMLGAFIGLFIAYGSYFILNTINPALVNLRLPQTWMIKPLELMPKYCSQLANGTKLELAGEADQKIDKSKMPNTFSLTKGKDKLVCDKKYFVLEGGGNTCVGDYCKQSNTDQTEMCVVDVKNSKNIKMPKYVCSDGNVVGFVYSTAIFKGGVSGYKYNNWTSPPFADSAIDDVDGYYAPVGLFGICFDGTIKKPEIIWTVTNELSDETQGYNVNISNAEIKEIVYSECNSNGGFRGFVLVVVFNGSFIKNSQSHVVGVNGVDLGDLKDGNLLGFFPKFNNKIAQKYFFTADQIQKGVVLDINAASIRVLDVDVLTLDWLNDPSNQRFKYYNYLISK